MIDERVSSTDLNSPEMEPGNPGSSIPEDEVLKEEDRSLHKETPEDEQNVDEPENRVAEEEPSGISGSSDAISQEVSPSQVETTGANENNSPDEEADGSSVESDEIETTEFEEGEEYLGVGENHPEVEKPHEISEAESEESAEKEEKEESPDDVESSDEAFESEEKPDPGLVEDSEEEETDEGEEDYQVDEHGEIIEGDEAEEPEPEEDNKNWYVVKVQSGREESIRDAIERRVKIENLEEFYGEILIPVEKETVVNKGKRVVRERKLFPGYIMARVEYNDQMLYLFRETSGVGDFVGGGPNHDPQPMTDREVEVMLKKAGKAPDEVAGEAPTQKSPYSVGDRIRVKDGVFSGMDGDVKEVLEAKNLVRIELVVLGRPVPVELEYWQVEPV